MAGVSIPHPSSSRSSREAKAATRAASSCAGACRRFAHDPPRAGGRFVLRSSCGKSWAAYHGPDSSVRAHAARDLEPTAPPCCSSAPRNSGQEDSTLRRTTVQASPAITAATAATAAPPPMDREEQHRFAVQAKRVEASSAVWAVCHGAVWVHETSGKPAVQQQEPCTSCRLGRRRQLLMC